MAHGKSLELRRVGGGTAKVYLLPGQRFEIPRKQWKAARMAKKMAKRKQMLAARNQPSGREEPGNE